MTVWEISLSSASRPLPKVSGEGLWALSQSQNRQGSLRASILEEEVKMGRGRRKGVGLAELMGTTRQETQGTQFWCRLTLST
jgi:hypothetical protein